MYLISIINYDLKNIFIQIKLSFYSKVTEFFKNKKCGLCSFASGALFVVFIENQMIRMQRVSISEYEKYF